MRISHQSGMSVTPIIAVKNTEKPTKNIKSNNFTDHKIKSLIKLKPIKLHGLAHFLHLINKYFCLKSKHKRQLVITIYRSKYMKPQHRMSPSNKILLSMH